MSGNQWSLRFGALPSDFEDVPRPPKSPELRRRAAVQREAAAARRRRQLELAASANDDDDLLPPPSFILLEEIATWLLRLLRWLMTGERSPFEAPTPAAAKAKLPPVNHSARRYPYCLVWTPIHPITWVCPYVGHVGLCDVEGIVLDFAGKHVGRDKMAFGWPARFVQLSPSPETDWDGEISRATTQFHRVEYNFLTWNCHSFLAAFLNNISWPHDPMASILGCWTVAGVGLRIFIDGRYIGRRRWKDDGGGAGLLSRGALQQWGGTLGVTALCVGVGTSRGNWDFAYAWAYTVFACNSFFFFWFGLMALLRLSSTRGSVDLSTLTEVSEGEESDDDDDDGLCRTGL